MAFKDRLRELRERKGMSQAQLSDTLNISKSSVSMYERGERNPDFDTLEIIADFFNVDMNYLLGKEDGSTYYLDPEAAEIAETIAKRPEMKLLFDASSKVSSEDLMTVIALMDRLKKDEKGEE